MNLFLQTIDPGAAQGQRHLVWPASKYHRHCISTKPSKPVRISSRITRLLRLGSFHLGLGRLSHPHATYRSQQWIEVMQACGYAASVPTHSFRSLDASACCPSRPHRQHSGPRYGTFHDGPGVECNDGRQNNVDRRDSPGRHEHTVLSYSCPTYAVQPAVLLSVSRPYNVVQSQQT